jgi:predicted Holliday junction resolvase-like endonuclease
MHYIQMEGLRKELEKERELREMDVQKERELRAMDVKRVEGQLQKERELREKELQKEKEVRDEAVKRAEAQVDRRALDLLFASEYEGLRSKVENFKVSEPGRTVA